MPSKARPRQTNRATNSATETPLKTRRDFFRHRIARRRSSLARDRATDSTEWRCRQHPSRGCSFAGRQLQSSANKEQRPRIYESKNFANAGLDRGLHGYHGLDENAVRAFRTKCFRSAMRPRIAFRPVFVQSKATRRRVAL